MHILVAVAPLMRYRVWNDARELGRLVVVSQSVDCGKNANERLEDHDLKRFLMKANFGQCGRRMGPLLMYVGMRVRLSDKILPKYGLVHDAVG